MKKTDTHAFVNQLLIGLLVTIGLGGSIGLGTVWMRHQVSVTANLNRQLEAKILELDRRLDETKSLIETELSPVLLRDRNAGMRLGLIEVSEKNLVRVTESPTDRLIARANSKLYDGDRAESLSRITLGQ